MKLLKINCTRKLFLRHNKQHAMVQAMKHKLTNICSAILPKVNWKITPKLPVYKDCFEKDMRTNNIARPWWNHSNQNSRRLSRLSIKSQPFNLTQLQQDPKRTKCSMRSVLYRICRCCHHYCWAIITQIKRWWRVEAYASWLFVTIARIRTRNGSTHSHMCTWYTIHTLTYINTYISYLNLKFLLARISTSEYWNVCGWQWYESWVAYKYECG